jgi:hypothetical protein
MGRQSADVGGTGRAVFRALVLYFSRLYFSRLNFVCGLGLLRRRACRRIRCHF